MRRRAAVVAAAAAAWAVWASGPGWSTPALVVAAVGGAALGVVDARTHRLPNALLFPTAAGVGVLLVLAAVAGGDLGALLRAVLGATALGLGYLLLHLLDRSGLGLGDVKLAVLLGATSAWYGWGALAGAALLPFLVGGLVAVALLVTRRANRRTALAFGPYMLLGTVLAITAARLGA
ncbi:prepilin peptidase [Isoptericola cucumis]|uniref:prepilin peptidase n=1 Tax=Isoptericola cucumis TaxID=1776856 RepID=UPI0039EE0C0C